MEFAVWQSDKPDIYSGQPALYAGRMLTLEDAGQPLIVLPLEFADPLDIALGDRLRLDIAPDLELEVVGIMGNSGGGVSFGGPGGLVPPAVLPASLNSGFTLYAFQVPDAELNRALAQLSSVIFALAIDVQFIDGLISRLIDQFAAIPTIVGLLSLFAAAVIMANTVALATLERRRQIGILKAIGLTSRRVLQVMFIESSLIGLLSALLGIGVSALCISLLSAAGGIAIPPARRRPPHRPRSLHRRPPHRLGRHLPQRPRRPQRTSHERPPLRLTPASQSLGAALYVARNLFSVEPIK